jgi:LuxR family maltose regulon positive regulatory protein
MPECALSYCLYELNDLEEAARLQQNVIQQCLASGDYQVLTAGYAYLALTRSAQGDFTGAAEAIGNADRYAKVHGVAPSFRAQVAGYGALIAFRQDDADASANWGEQVIEYGDAMPSFQNHIPIRVLIARGEKDAAAERLRTLSVKAVQDDLQLCLLRIRIYHALLAATPDEALTFLTEALKLGQPEGFIRSFVDEGRQLAPLLRRALHQGVTPEYTARLLNIIATEEGWRRSVGGTAATASPSGLLSEREMEILELLAAGHSNRQIAERLIVTAGTVKVHVHNVMGKLNARSRTQAVSLARALKLL